MTTPEQGGDSIEALLRASRQDISDAGFSNRVLAALPQRSLIREACPKRVVILLVAFVTSCLLSCWAGIPQDLLLRPETAQLNWSKLVKLDPSAAHAGSHTYVRWDLQTLHPPAQLLVEELAAAAIAFAGMSSLLRALIEER